MVAEGGPAQRPIFRIFTLVLVPRAAFVAPFSSPRPVDSGQLRSLLLQRRPSAPIGFPSRPERRTQAQYAPAVGPRCLGPRHGAAGPRESPETRYFGGNNCHTESLAIDEGSIPCLGETAAGCCWRLPLRRGKGVVLFVRGGDASGACFSFYGRRWRCYRLSGFGDI